MVIAHETFHLIDCSPLQLEEIQEVGVIAGALRQELERISDLIDSIHVWRAKSDDIQATFFPWLQAHYDVGFESRDGFEQTSVRFNRPDAQLSLDERRRNRVMIEVERGGTVTNNHDLKDLWKAHLSPSAKHLFLVVPNSITNEDGKLRADNAFNRCVARLSTFFGEPRTQVDVWSVHLFGYGPRHGK